MSQSEDAGTLYLCPMHPELRQPNSGKCTRCGMDLLPEGTLLFPRVIFSFMAIVAASAFSGQAASSSRLLSHPLENASFDSTPMRRMTCPTFRGINASDIIDISL